ncbi:MAG: BatD family protein [Candidatus Neomarinimicrobiota bacterium]|nr:BatD family protein [Candidatus Neomarinimicrobiota bacterium]
MVNYLRLFLIYLFLLSHMYGGSVRATVDANSITINETFTFRIEAQETDKMPSVNISSLLDDFTIVSGPAQQTNYSWTNGKSASTKSLSWTLSPNRAGRLVIPELIISTGGKKYKTNPIRINVQKSGAVASAKELFILTEIDKDELYMGEQVTVTYKLYTRVQLGLEKIDYPKSVGFWQEDLSIPQPPRFNRTPIKGVEYQVATLYKVALFPTKTGSLEISPMSITAQVRKKQKNNRRSIWDDPFFSSFNNRTVQKLIRTDVVKVNVNPYPEGQPADFTGAVGDFNIRTWVDTSEVRINEAVTLNVELRGTGNINMFSLPEINFPGDMDVFPPNSSFEKEKLWDQYTGTILWEYILIPRGSGRYQLPRIQLSFLNPKDGSWNKAGAKSISLNVLPGEDDFISSTKGFTKEEISLLGSDIRYNTTSISNWVLRNEPTISIRSLSSHIIAAILFLLPIPITRFKGHRLNNARKRQSNKALKKALKNLTKSEEDPFMQVSRVLYIYLKDRFFLSSEHLDPLSVKRTLKGIIEADHLDALIKILKLCDAGRYGPEASEVQDTLLDDAKNILYKLDSNR